MKHFFYYVTGQNSRDTITEVVHVYRLIGNKPRPVGLAKKGYRDHGQAVVDILVGTGQLDKRYAGWSLNKLEYDKVARVHQL